MQVVAVDLILASTWAHSENQSCSSFLTFPLPPALHVNLRQGAFPTPMLTRGNSLPPPPGNLPNLDSNKYDNFMAGSYHAFI